VKSAAGSAQRFFGDQANPKRGLPALRRAAVCAETKCCIRSTGAAVQPKAASYAHAALPSGLDADRRNAAAADADGGATPASVT
jgi:hypothetical protein